MKTSTRCVADSLSAGKISEDKPPDLGPGISIRAIPDVGANVRTQLSAQFSTIFDV